MTNQEAINLISRNKSVFQHDAEMLMALDIAINALNTMDFVEDMSNEISRLKKELKGKQNQMDERDADAFESGYIAGLNADKPKGEWIPVSERLPDDLEPVNITWINHEPEPYYKEIKDKPFTATGVYFNGQWYWWSTLCTDTLAEYSHNYDDIIDTAIEVIAWQELPEPYKKGGKEE